MHSATHHAVAAVWRIESARIVAAVGRVVRDLGAAEEPAQDALAGLQKRRNVVTARVGKILTRRSYRTFSLS